ncbi:uncharacterized protein EV154DRAFT_528842 [Mucor mucedo]|uniref:uncharacterized protein n=1 Tax=Mucor mucedo TaxID=29922 RepID=UPI002220FDAE|nr:uncharacterized protein EV154DRAFT_528842 [Mucor mucedo]KAI7873154.1 hypothetical protein EV154DRAFT_528842 [Mucor mucedo]
MVQSIVSTFFGVCFPHTVVCDEDNDEVFIQLYEASSAKFSVKVITTIVLLEKCVQEFFPGADIEAFLCKKEPLMMVVNALGTSFLGTIFEEKFHLKCLSAFILPCVPLIPEHMKRMVHPDVSPNHFEEGIKNGYYMVSLSLNQTFGPPEFHATEDQESDTEIPEDANMQHNQNFLNSDNDEIESKSDMVSHTENEDEDRLDSTQDSIETENVESSDEERDQYDNLSSQGNGESTTSREINERYDVSSQEQEPNVIQKTVIIASDTSESSRTTQSSSPSSNTLSIVAALKKSHLRSSSQYSSSSEKSKGSSVTPPFRFGSNNTAQQNLNIYIANSRSTMPSSKFFKTLGPKNDKSRPKKQVIAQEKTNDYAASETPEIQERQLSPASFENTKTKYGKRKRFISSGNNEKIQTSCDPESSKTSNIHTPPNNEVVSYDDGQSDEFDKVTSDSDFSAEMPKTK